MSTSSSFALSVGGGVLVIVLVGILMAAAKHWAKGFFDEIGTQVAAANKQLVENGGSSLKDQMNRIEESQKLAKLAAERLAEHTKRKFKKQGRDIRRIQEDIIEQNITAGAAEARILHEGKK